MNIYKIAHRYGTNEDFSRLSTLRVGMCITARINENYEPLITTLPFHDFVYIVSEIKEGIISLIDTSHNNNWTITPQELESVELVEEFHRNVDHVDCEFINRVLSDLDS